MTIKLTFKCPDVVFYATENIEDVEDKFEAEEACKKWIKYGELLTVEIDTQTGECTPIKV